MTIKANLDTEILNLFVNSKDTYTKYSTSIHIEGDINILILDQIDLIYINTNNNNNISKDILINIINKLFPNHGIELLDYIDIIYNISIDNSLVQTILDKALVKSKILQIVEKLETKRNEDDYETLSDISDLLLDVSVSNIEYGNLSLNDLTLKNTGLIWPLAHFNNMLGPIPESSFGLIFAPVGTGKTALLTTLGAYWAKTNYRVLHLNNEDPYKKLLERYYVNYFERPKQYIFDKMEQASKRFVSENKNRLILVDSADFSLQNIDHMIKSIQPDMVFIDQLDPLSKENDPSSLEVLYRKIRNIAKKRNTRIIGVTQASDSARDKAYLSMRDIHNSKVGKPASFDYMIGINQPTTVDSNKRFVSIPKNKLMGIEGTPTHGMITFNPELIRYED